VKFENLT